jgi:hypothetical protein
MPPPRLYLYFVLEKNMPTLRILGKEIFIFVRIFAAATFAFALSFTCFARQGAQVKDGSVARIVSEPPQAQPAQAPFIGAWRPIGPQPSVPATGNIAGSSGNTSGRVEAIAIDPTDATGNTVFIGGAQGGVWKTTDGGVTWQPLTDSQASLAMGALAIAIDPTNSLDAQHRVIYAATGEQAGTGVDIYYGAGVLKSLDGGQTWAQTCQGTAFSNASCPFAGPFNSGFFPGGGARIGVLAVNPGNPKMLIAATQIFPRSNISGQIGQSGVYCTGDGGGTWTRIQPTGETATAIATAAFYVSATTAYAAIGSYGGDVTNGIYVSHNADQVCSAQIWVRIPAAGLPTQFPIGRIELAAAPALVNGQIVLYAGITDADTNSNTLLGVYRSADGGNTWAQLTGIPDFCGPHCSYDLVIGVDPADVTGNTVFFGGAGTATPAGTTLLRSTDGGQTFGDVSKVGDGTFLHANHHAIAFTSGGSKMFVGNDGGVWSSTNAANPATATGSQAWTNLNSDLALTQFNPGFSIHPANAGLAFGGTQGNGTQEFQNLSGVAAWTGTNTCTDGGFTVVDANDPSSVYLSCAGSVGSAQIYKSATGGVSGAFSLLASSSTIGVQANGSRDPLAAFPPLVSDPKQAAHLYYATYRLFETTDGAATWNSVSGDLTSGGLANGSSVTSVAFAPISTGAYNLYTGANDGTVESAINVSPGSSPTFTNISGALPARAVTKIIADSSDVTGKTAYVAFSGFSIDVSISGSPTDLKGHIFKTTNGGASWSDVGCHTADCAIPLGTDLPNSPVNDILLDPDDPTRGTLFAATDIGIFVTANGGATWATLGAALPNVPVLSLALHEPSRTLRAATHGRSAWDYSLPAQAGTTPFALSQISPISTQAGGGALTVTLTGSGFTANSTVRWNGASTGVSSVQVNTATQTITAQIAASLLAQPGTAAVTVFDSNLTPNTTNALTLTVLGSAPTLIAVVPASVNAGASDTAITISGTGFNQNAQVTFSNSTTGVTGTTVNAAGTQITATLSHTLLRSGGQFFIGVTNLPPGGGAASPQLLFTVNNAAPPANDNFVNAIAVTSAIFSSSVDNSGATSEATDPIPPCVAGASQNPTGKSVWWKYTAGSAGNAVVSTLGSSYDTVLSVYTGAPGNFVNVACNNDVSASVKQSQVQIAVTPNATYFFMVTVFDTTLCPPAGTNSAECGGATVFNLNGPIPAGLVALPPSMSITAGASATFTIGTLSPPFSGQVAFSISGCPPVSTCTFSPSSIVAGGSISLSVTTTATGAAPPSRNLRRLLPRSPAPANVWGLLLAVTMLFCVSLRKHRPRGAITFAPLVLLLLGVALVTGGCGFTSDNTPPVAPPSTAAGVYSLVVTATATGNVTATTTISLTVN